VVRTDDGALHHVEFQATKEAWFGMCMLGDYYYLISAHGQQVLQTGLHVGRDPLACCQVGRVLEFVAVLGEEALTAPAWITTSFSRRTA